MSNNIGEFKSVDGNGETMCVTAFVGKDGDASVQFTIGYNAYNLLDSFEIERLIKGINNKSIIVNIYLPKNDKASKTFISSGFKSEMYIVTIGDYRCALSGGDMKRLATILQKRIDRVKGFRATD